MRPRRIFAIRCPDCKGAGRLWRLKQHDGRVVEDSKSCELCLEKGAIFVEPVGPAPISAVEPF